MEESRKANLSLQKGDSNLFEGPSDIKETEEIYFLCILKSKQPGADAEAAAMLAHMAMDRSMQLNLTIAKPLERCPPLRTRICDFSENDCWNCFCNQEVRPVQNVGWSETTRRFQVR